MHVQTLSVISIAPDPARPLGLDLKHILSALGELADKWVWCVRDLDWLGDDGEALCRAVEASGPGGLWVDSRDLIDHSRRIIQTIEGTFLAFPESIDRREVEPSDLDLSSFPTSKAEAAIVALDGTCFDIYSKDARVADSLHETFPTARDELLDRYF